MFLPNVEDENQALDASYEPLHNDELDIVSMPSTSATGQKQQKENETPHGVEYSQ